MLFYKEGRLRLTIDGPEFICIRLASFFHKSQSNSNWLTQITQKHILCCSSIHEQFGLKVQLDPGAHQNRVFLNLISFFLKKSVYLCIWLLLILVEACEFLVAACGIWFPDQGSNPGPLH